MLNMQQSVIATLVFHDILNYPMTAWEVFQFQIAEDKPAASFGDVLTMLEKLREIGEIEEKNGFYFLRARSALVEERIERTKIAEEKWHRTRKTLSLLRMTPFIRGAALAGSIARQHTGPLSDIDFLAITQAGRIWTGRFFLTLFALLTGRLRPGWYTRRFFPLARRGKKGSFSNKLCLSHYLATTNPVSQNQNLYTALMHAQITPLWGMENFEEFFSVNEWIHKYLPNFEPCVLQRKTFARSRTLSLLQGFFELPFTGPWGDLLERVLRSAQMFLIRHNPLTASPGKVAVRDTELAFHPNLRDEEVLDNFAKKMAGSYGS